MGNCCRRSNSWKGEGNELEPMEGSIFKWQPHTGEPDEKTDQFLEAIACLSCCSAPEDILAVGSHNIGDLRSSLRVWELDLSWCSDEVERRSGISVTTIHVEVEGARIEVIMSKRLNFDETQPALIYAHAGGGVVRSPQLEQPLCAKMALDLGCIVFNVGYRLAPEHKSPQGVVDFANVIKYIHANATQWNIDTSRIVVGGMEGGAMIATAAVFELAVQGKEKLVKAMFLWSPMLSDELTRADYNVLNDYEEYFVKMGRVAFYNNLVDDVDSKQNDPYIYPGKMPEEYLQVMPKTVVFTAEFDIYRRDAIAYINRLKSVDRLLDYYSQNGVSTNYEFSRTYEADNAKEQTIMAWNHYIVADNINDPLRDGGQKDGENKESELKVRPELDKTKMILPPYPREMPKPGEKQIAKYVAEYEVARLEELKAQDKLYVGKAETRATLEKIKSRKFKLRLACEPTLNWEIAYHKHKWADVCGSTCTGDCATWRIIDLDSDGYFRLESQLHMPQGYTVNLWGGYSTEDTSVGTWDDKYDNSLMRIVDDKYGFFRLEPKINQNMNFRLHLPSFWQVGSASGLGTSLRLGPKNCPRSLFMVELVD